MQKANIKNVLFCAFTLIGAVVGAGFASGAEIAVYFSSLGVPAIFFIFLSMLFTAFLYYYLVSFSKKRKIKNIRQLCSYAIPKRGELLYYVILCGAIVSCGAMLSSAGSLFYEFLSVPRWVVSAITGGTGVLVVIKGLEGIGIVNKWIVPVTVTFNVVLFLCVPKALYVKNIDTGIINGIFNSSVYAIFNMALSLGLIISLSGRANLKEHKMIALVVAVILFICITMIHTVLSTTVLSFDKTQIPLLPVVTKWSALAVYLYVWVLMGEIFTTYIASLYNFVPLCKKQSMKTVIISAGVISFLLSFVKLSSIVKYIYPLSGISCIILVIGMIVKQKQTGRMGTNEVLRNSGVRTGEHSSQRAEGAGFKQGSRGGEPRLFRG